MPKCSKDLQERVFKLLSGKLCWTVDLTVPCVSTQNDAEFFDRLHCSSKKQQSLHADFQLAASLAPSPSTFNAAGC